MDGQFEVLVVGAGPAGLTLGCDLLRRGISLRIVDAAESGYPGSRAKGLQPRTLEVFNDLGVLDDVRARAERYPKLGLHLGPVTVPKTMIRLHEPTDDVPFPDTLLIAQYDTDACLRRRLEALGGSVEFSTRLDSYEQHADGVVATVVGPGGEEVVRSRFLVGADGASSTVRKQAGIEFVGSTDDSDRMILADVVVDGLSRDRWHMWPRRAGRFTALCPLPGGDRFQLMIRLRSDEDPALDIEALDGRVREVTGRRVREVHWTSVWRPNVRLAARYRDGNVLLVGDAAHVHTPAGAQGLNTGVQDAYNLGWKLGQVLAGASDGLLDTYEAERRPIAARVLGLSSELYGDIAGNKLAAMKRGDEERQLTVGYRGGPLAALDGAAGRVQQGDRAPDATYSDPDGNSSRLFDAFRGPHFTLIAVGDDAIHCLSDLTWPERGAPLETVVIAAASGARRSAWYDLGTPAQILVRPDGYIAHIARRDFAAALARSLSAMAPDPTAQ